MGGKCVEWVVKCGGMGGKRGRMGGKCGGMGGKCVEWVVKRGKMGGKCGGMGSTVSVRKVWNGGKVWWNGW
jgi:hypothetical protein